MQEVQHRRPGVKYSIQEVQHRRPGVKHSMHEVQHRRPGVTYSRQDTQHGVVETAVFVFGACDAATCSIPTRSGLSATAPKRVGADLPLIPGSNPRRDDIPKLADYLVDLRNRPGIGQEWAPGLSI